MNKNYTKNSLFPIGALFCTIKRLKIVFGVNKMILVFLLFFVQAAVVAQTIGDYQSKASGNWTELVSWERWNGTSWVEPTAGQGYPGQNTGTGAVVIQFGQTITMNIATIPQSIGQFTISGQLKLLDDISHTINTSLLIVTSTSGVIVFGKKSDLKLPSNASIQVSNGGLEGDCSNNNSLFLGATEIAVCVGGGKTTPTFQETMDNGGYNSVKVTPESASSCGPRSFTFTATVFPSLGATIQWYDLPTGGTPLQNGGGSYDTGLITTTKTYYVEAVYSNYTTPRKAVTVTVNTTAAAKIDKISHPGCVVPTGSVDLSGLPTSGTIKQTGLVTKSYPITATTMTISDLAAGDYYFAVNNGTCESVISPVVTIVDKSSTTWNGNVWSNGEPSLTSRIIFAGNYNSTKDVIGCDCTVNNGANVVFKYIDPTLGHTLTVKNDVKVLGSGTLTFENNASLVQTANSITNTNSGKITYQRQTSPYKQFDYIYWSSPVVGQILRDVSPLTPLDKFYSFDVATYDWKQENTNSPMTNGVGYIIRGADYVLPKPPGLHQASFFGIPNNGLITVPIPSTAVNSESSALLGNPYPSALDANEFLKGNNSILEGTLYFWTHNTAIQNVGNITNGSQGSGALAYTSDDYATYNLTGGVTVVSTGNIVAGTAQTGNKPSGKIASGQSFFAGINAVAGTVKFENSMRVGVGNLTGDNTQFFRTASGKSDVTSAYENHRVWLNLTNMQGAFKQLLVGYITGATNAYDPFFDGVSFDGNEFVDFYSITGDETLTIQGRALPFEEDDFVALGYSSAIEGDFSISIDEVDGLLIGQNIYLEDKLNNTIHNLTKEAYTFGTTKGTFDDRFVLRYTDKTLGVGDFNATDKQVLVLVKNKQLKINSSVETIDKVFIYDMLGKQVYEKINVENKEVIISNLGSSGQVLIVKTVLQNGTVITAKTIY